MSNLFPALDTARSGLHTNRVWMDAIADNIANINTINPYNSSAFQARFIVAKAIRSDAQEPIGVGGGVTPDKVVFGDKAGRLRYEPGHPYANPDGYVRYPDIDLGDQMTMLLMSQRAYQLNLAVVDKAKEAYQQALSINGR